MTAYTIKPLEWREDDWEDGSGRFAACPVSCLSHGDAVICFPEKNRSTYIAYPGRREFGSLDEAMAYVWQRHVEFLSEWLTTTEETSL